MDNCRALPRRQPLLLQLPLLPGVRHLVIGTAGLTLTQTAAPTANLKPELTQIAGAILRQFLDRR